MSLQRNQGTRHSHVPTQNLALPAPFPPIHLLLTHRARPPRTSLMAKSIRSKVKRSFRNKKREEGVYAATEAARLARLHAKLTAVATNDADGDAPIRDAQEDGAAEGEEAWVDDAPEGRCLLELAVLGLVDPDALSPEVAGALWGARTERTVDGPRIRAMGRQRPCMTTSPSVPSRLF